MTATTRDPRERSAYERMFRTVALALGVGALLLLGANLSSVLFPLVVYRGWWTAGVLGGIAACGVALLVLGRRASMGVLRGVGAVLGLVIAAGLALAPLATVAGPPGSERAPWLFDVAVLGATGFALAFRPLGAWIGAVALAALMVATATPLSLTLGAPTPLLAAATDTFFLFVCFAIALATLRAGRMLDERAAAASAQARLAATAGAHAVDDARLHALLHDHVLSTLLAYAQSGRDSAVARDAATRALAALDAADRPSDPLADRADLDERAALWALQGVVTEVAPTALFRVEGEVDPERRVPPEVVEALNEATREALKNSARHGRTADREPTCLVRVLPEPGGIRVRVVDDGRGFDPERIGEARLGVRVSILARMRGVTGGSARVASRPGHGTVVELDWRRA